MPVTSFIVNIPANSVSLLQFIYQPLNISIMLQVIFILTPVLPIIIGIHIASPKSKK